MTTSTQSREVLLVFPQLMVFDLEVERATSSVFPLGLAYVAGALEAAGITVTTADMVTDRLTIPELRTRLERIRPKVVGLSVTTVSYSRALQVAAAVKAWNPGVPVVFGGPHASVAYQQILEAGPVDVAVIGEGEETMVEIVQAVRRGASFADIAGLGYREHGRITINRRRPFIRDLDRLAPPAVHQFGGVKGLRASYEYYPVCSGRGCTYTCSFCAAGSLSGRAYRVRSPENVVAEMKQVADDHGVDQFFIVDDTFTAVPERAYAICELIRRDLPQVKWVCECRTNTVSRHLLAAMVEAGCHKLQFGIESGNQEVLNRVLKGTTLGQIEQAVVHAFEAGMDEVVGSFIIGLPGETYATALETIRFAMHLTEIAERFTQETKRAHRFTPFMASLIPLPQVRCTRDAAAMGIVIEDDSPHAFISDAILTHTQALNAKDIRELVLLGELALNRLSLPGLSFKDRQIAFAEMGGPGAQAGPALLPMMSAQPA